MEHLDEIVDEEWDQILDNGRDILHQVGAEEMRTVKLGASAS